MKRNLLLVAFLGIFLISASALGAGTKVSIDRGLNLKGCIAKDTTFVLQVSFHNDFGTLSGVSFPFHLYSETGELTDIVHVADAAGVSAEFPQGTSLNDQSIFVYNGWDGIWTMFQFFHGANWDGILPDTINFTGISISGWSTTADTTMYFGFNLQFSADLWGNAFCIDSIDHEDNTYDWLTDAPNFEFGGTDPYCWCVGEPADVATFGDRNGLPETFEMGQNYPNPFNMTTVIEYAVPYKSEVTITVYNVLGQKINTVVNEEMPAGYHEAKWDGTNQEGTEVASGLYFYKIETDNFKDTKKLMLLK